MVKLKLREKRREEDELRGIFLEVREDWFKSNGISKKAVFTDSDNIEYTYFDGQRIFVPLELQNFDSFMSRLRSKEYENA